MLQRKYAFFCIDNYHSLIFSVIKNCVINEKLLIRCVDYQYRQCFSFLAKFICDYEKQTLITDIKND